MARREDQQFASSPGVRRRMQAIRSANTEPEVLLRRALWRRGLRYRVNVRPEPTMNRTADVVFTRQRVAVFVDGCFWHGCPEHGRRQYTVNGWYWPDKIARNRRRDDDTNRRLADAGWEVIRIWEHEDPERAAAHVGTVVARRTTSPDK